MDILDFKVWDLLDEKLIYPDEEWTLHNLSDFELEFFPFTGLKDAEGTKIYSGDILKSVLQGRLFNWVVSFEDGSFVIRNIGVDGYQETTGYKLDQSMAGMRRVIGHCKTHPELLNIPNT